MAYVLNASLNMRNRDNTPGNSSIYITETTNITAYTYNAAETYISGLTMSGSTKFYEFKMPRENITWENKAQISVQNGVYTFIPNVKFNLPGLSVAALNLFDVLVRKSVTVIVKTNEGKYVLVGQSNGLDIDSDSSYLSGNGGVELIGSQVSLSGLENKRIFEIDPTYASTLVASISVAA